MTNPNQNFIWDKVVRLTHWGVAIAVLLNLFVVEEGETVHEYLGYLAVGLVVIRLLWGLTLAKNEARLAALKPSISGIKSHLGELKSRQETHRGHNPLGVFAVFALWLLVLTTGVSGYIASTDWGIDNDIDNLHEVIANLLMIMVYIHVFAVIVTSFIFKRNLVKSMTFRRAKK